MNCGGSKCWSRITSTWCSAKALLRVARVSPSIGWVKSRPTTSAPVCPVSGVMVKDGIWAFPPHDIFAPETLGPRGGAVKQTRYAMLEPRKGMGGCDEVETRAVDCVCRIVGERRRGRAADHQRSR